MADLFELLAPYLDVPEAPSSLPTITNDHQTSTYLNRLGTLSLGDLTTTEPASLLHAAQSQIRNLQALSKRSHRAVITSSTHLANLTSLLPSLSTHTSELNNELPELESAASAFAQKYDRSTENAVLDRRKRAMLLSRNVDRVSDVLELPTLLSSTVAAAQAPSSQSAASSTTSYASALDLHAHVKRLNALYPKSALVGNISKQAESEIQNLTSVLITSLQSPALKLAAAMRTVGWLKRVAPDLADDRHGHLQQATSIKSLGIGKVTIGSEGGLGALFLVCRLRTLYSTLEALEPLRELADQEKSQTGRPTKGPAQISALGTQSERYLKRYIEIFREQSFAIVSTYKSIFPTDLPTHEATTTGDGHTSEDPLQPLPSPLASFALHLVDMLSEELREYLPNITDKQSRESLLTQVLYCAGSLGRLGADFGMMIALLEEELASEEAEAEQQQDEEDPGWVQVMQKHRIQAGRLEVLARGVGTGGSRKPSVEVPSPA
ncbi:Dor1-domain-containing protein [Teratosphaeria nubilosa]|uniref:Conserved oligomeric Golgi complex subunit 8 n=1 Tax=Teratosphaeria nubilosa TaxID=161662 RepID=A0A6G1LLG6_9PEZI|nr:Dor1-domain-containing protein [Teratosphaeria nubilosa]